MFEETGEESFKITGSEIVIIKRENFRERLKATSKDRLLCVQRKLQTKDMQVSSLTDEELDEMIALYRAQINEKKKYLNS